MLTEIRNLFRPANQRRDALNSMARIVSRYGMTRLVYERGLEEDKRESNTIYASAGVWMFPGLSESLDVSNSIPGVTRDLRPSGLGIMSLLPVLTPALVVAIPDDEERWSFVECEVRHKAVVPGGWHSLGVEITGSVDLAVDTIIAFNKRCAKVMQPSRGEKN